MTNKPRAWLGRKIAELAVLLKRMPEDRERAFSDVLDEGSPLVLNSPSAYGAVVIDALAAGG